MRVPSPLPFVLAVGSYALVAFWVAFVALGWLVFAVWLLGFCLYVQVSDFFAGAWTEFRRICRGRT